MFLIPIFEVQKHLVKKTCTALIFCTNC